MSLINREALLAEYDRVHVGEPGKARKLIEDAPTIELRCEECEAFNKTRLLIPQPERKKGKWTKDCACEICGFKPWYERDIHTLSFCPNCGADMRGDNDDQSK